MSYLVGGQRGNRSRSNNSRDRDRDSNDSSTGERHRARIPRAARRSNNNSHHSDDNNNDSDDYNHRHRDSQSSRRSQSFSLAAKPSAVADRLRQSDDRPWGEGVRYPHTLLMYSFKYYNTPSYCIIYLHINLFYLSYDDYNTYHDIELYCT